MSDLFHSVGMPICFIIACIFCPPFAIGYAIFVFIMYCVNDNKK